MRALPLFLAASSLCTGALAATPYADNPKLLYQLYCQGCHTPDGTGGGSVPQLRGQVGQFMRSESGREFLVRVPGASTSILDDAELASVLNWMLEEFAGESLPPDFAPYTASEVGRVRGEPLNEVVAHRREVLAEIEAGEGTSRPAE